jgi:hypothetical protein
MLVATIGETILQVTGVQSEDIGVEILAWQRIRP